MRDPFIFQIKPITMNEGLLCEGIMDEPLPVERLFEAVLLASQLGQGLDFEIRSSMWLVMWLKCWSCGGRLFWRIEDEDELSQNSREVN
jgi:hypothetical protein